LEEKGYDDFNGKVQDYQIQAELTLKSSGGIIAWNEPKSSWKELEWLSCSGFMEWKF